LRGKSGFTENPYGLLLMVSGTRRDDPLIFLKKRVFWSEKGQDPEQSKDLGTRNKTTRGTPKNTIQRKNPLTGIPNFGWRTAAAGLKPLAAEWRAAALGLKSLRLLRARSPGTGEGGDW